jgi:tRNA pseudouridine38-40 synthase
VRLAFRTCYLGDRFEGSQIQTGARTVEGEFVAACVRLGLFSDWRSAGFLAAGRTDRGVHARGQVYAFSTQEPDRAIEALNWQLPKDCWCIGYAMVDPGFHPRYDTRSRTYRYYFTDPDLAVGEMSRAAGALLGTHDFSCFARVRDKNPVRTVLNARMGMAGGLPFFEVQAESFLWHMVRYMAAALSLVGTGEEDGGMIGESLTGEAGHALAPAPPEGLILWDVETGFRFDPLDKDDRSRRFIRRERGRHAVMTEICRLIGEEEEEFPGGL